MNTTIYRQIFFPFTFIHTYISQCKEQKYTGATIILILCNETTRLYCLNLEKKQQQQRVSHEFFKDLWRVLTMHAGKSVSLVSLKI